MQQPTIRNCLLCTFATATAFLSAYAYGLSTGKIVLRQESAYTVQSVQGIDRYLAAQQGGK